VVYILQQLQERYKSNNLNYLLSDLLLSGSLLIDNLLCMICSFSFISGKVDELEKVTQELKQKLTGEPDFFFDIRDDFCRLPVTFIPKK
jgi:hypothetical protein